MKEKFHQTLYYQPRRSEQFESEKEELIDLFGDKALTIGNIGSKAVLGLPAKDIVVRSTSSCTME